MATTIKLKNGSGAPLASDLVQGEPALDLTNKRLYSEDSGGTVIEIGTNPSTLSIAGTAVTSTAAELNILDGVTATAAELNLLDGVTATTAELNILDGVTSTAAELNILDGKAFLDEDDMVSDSATGIPSQQSVKAYVDSQVASADTLAELTDTNVTTPADGALLFYDTGTSKWIDNVVSGDITIADTGVAAIGSGVIVNADVNASAAIDVSKTALTAGTGLTLTTNTLSVDAAQTQITSVGTLSSLSVSGTLTLGGTAITSTAAELNILDGVTATTAELNFVDGVTSNIQTQLDAKGTGTVSSLSDLSITATAAELNILDGVTATTAELNYVDGVTSNIQTQIDNINPSPTLTATASGALANGDTVIVNSDGTVTAVTGSSVSQSAGTAATFESASTDNIGAAYDTNAQKVVIAYRDVGNSSYGTAVVGTVSGTSISFGTPVVFAAASSESMRVAYDANAQKVVIAFEDIANSGQGTAIVGTVSGTSISFGTETVFETGNADLLDIAYDENAQKVVISYRDNNNSDYGTAVVGTVSGTSISFGTPVVFESAGSQYTGIAYDANAQKVVIAYKDVGNSNYGTAIVGTVSGTSISFGTAAVFNTANTLYNRVVYDSSAQKIVIVYRDIGNSGHGTAIVGTVAGTSISFGSAVVFNAGSTLDPSVAYDPDTGKITIAYKDAANSNHGTAISGEVSGTSITFGSTTVFNSTTTTITATVYDSNEDKVVIAFEDDGGSDHGKAVVFTNASSTTNLTAENYIGISDAAYSDGATATIQLVGSVDDAQSSLTAGQQYFVQKDGSLGLTADDPSVVAGTAVSATEIIVKG